MNGKPMPVGQALHHAACIANGAAAAHDLRVVHRDLKPENIFVTSDGHTVVLDLGTAKVLGDVKGRQTQRVIGTVAYMSPEHLLGGVDGLPIDQRTDVYSLCLILYEMLAGFHPFAKNRDTRQMPSSTELARMQIYDMPEPLPDVAPWVPDYVWRIIRTGIAKEREQRQTTMRELEIEVRQAARWFVEERAAGERSSQRQKALSIDADTQPDPIPAFVSEETPRAPAPRLGTERLDSTSAPIRPAAIADTRTSPNLRLASPASPEPPAVTLGASAPKRSAIPRRVLLAPVVGALIGLVIVAGMNLIKRRASAPATASAAPAALAPALTLTLTPAPAPEPAAAPSPSRTPAPAPTPAGTATTTSPPQPRAPVAKREDAPRPINDDDDPSEVLPFASRTVGLVRAVHPLDLPQAQSQTLSDLDLRGAPLADAPHPFRAIELFSGHRQERQRHGETGTRNPTFQSGRNPTFSFWLYTRRSHLGDYVNRWHSGRPPLLFLAPTAWGTTGTVSWATGPLRAPIARAASVAHLPFRSSS